MKILFDATSYGTTSLVSPGLALFQGPALYFYNNAKFTDEDWEGLQRLMRSNKENNLLKVGRFGIGFNSVYHITGNINHFASLVLIATRGGLKASNLYQPLVI